MSLATKERGPSLSRPQASSKASLLGWAWLLVSAGGEDTHGPVQTALDGQEVFIPPKEIGVPLSTVENWCWKTAR